MSAPTDRAQSILQSAHRALARGAWEDARLGFSEALAAEEGPEALEGLGLSAWWLDLADVVFDARERAYRAYLSRGDKVSAARIAIWIGWDCWSFRGEDWLEGLAGPGSRLLEDAPHCRNALAASCAKPLLPVRGRRSQARPGPRWTRA